MPDTAGPCRRCRNRGLECRVEKHPQAIMLEQTDRQAHPPGVYKSRTNKPEDGVTMFLVVCSSCRLP
jgi:hypothetical protein